MYSKILLPVDAASLSRDDKVVQVASDLARHFNAQLKLFTVSKWSARDQGDGLELEQKRFKAKAQEIREHTGLDVTAAFRTGDVITMAIRDAVEEFGVDLVVMSSHDPSLADYLFGSRASTVTLHSRCSVLVVR